MNRGHCELERIPNLNISTIQSLLSLSMYNMRPIAAVSYFMLFLHEISNVFN